MADTRPWGPMDPNSRNQRWSRWTVVVALGRRRPSLTEVRENWQRYAKRVFQTSVGRARVENRATRPAPPGVFDQIVLMADVEGPPVHDPEYRAWVEREVAGVFVAKGFGPGARLAHFEASLLAGSAEDGRPPTQLLVLPPLRVARTD